MREFKTGATRDEDNDKPDYAGYLSALVIKRFGQYMLKHQRQKDGTKRGSNNWKKGIPKDAYVSSLARHHEDVQLYFEGFDKEMTEALEDSLCAIIFNAQGLLYEILKEEKSKDNLDYDWMSNLYLPKIPSKFLVLFNDIEEDPLRNVHEEFDEALEYWGC